MQSRDAAPGSSGSGALFCRLLVASSSSEEDDELSDPDDEEEEEEELLLLELQDAGSGSEVRSSATRARSGRCARRTPSHLALILGLLRRQWRQTRGKRDVLQ